MMARGYRANAAATMGVALAALALTAGCASTTSSTSTHAGAPSSKTLADLTRLAEQAASSQGGAARSAVAVRSTRRAANLAMGGDVVATDPDESVWAIVVVTKAPVVCGGCSIPAYAKAPQGTVITLVADTTSLAIVDTGLGDQVPNLAPLGPPVSLPV